MESKTIKFNPDLESEGGKLYRQYCEEKGIDYSITAGANFCLGYMAIKPTEAGARWISCADRLPPNDMLDDCPNEYCLKCMRDGRRGMPIYEQGNLETIEHMLRTSGYDVIYWLDESEVAQLWLSADTKPEHNLGVLVFIPGEDNHITSGMWDISNEWVLLDEYRTPEEEVTHWMPLPAFPEGYTHDVISDEWVSALKAIAKEELNKKGMPTAGRESNAVEFAEWIRENELTYNSHNGGYWYEYDTNRIEERYLCDTTAELYAIFKQQKQK